MTDKISDIAADIPVKISAVLGKAEITIGQLRQTEAGSIIELNKKSGDEIDIYAGDTLIARGEVMIDGDELGIRITEIISG